MTQYKLTYFNIRGRAELTRLVLAQAGVQYEDKRITKEEWAELKPKTPFGVVPILEFDGHTLGGGVEIARFIAEKHGVAGSNAVENAKISGIMDCMTDLETAFMTFYFEKDETRKAALKKKVEEEDTPKYLSLLEKLAASNLDGWFYGPKVSYVDFQFTHTVEYLQITAPNVLDDYPALKKLNENVRKLPNIAKWIQERPQTQY